MELEAEKPSFNAFERLLYFFIIPIIFTIVLLGALLSLFDYNIMNQVLKVGDKIPGLSAVLPDPKIEGNDGIAKKAQSGTGAGVEEGAEGSEELINSLKQKLADLEAELKKADTAYLQKDQALKETQAKFEVLEEQQKTKTKTDEEYLALIRETASVYAKMSSSKSAPIMENLTLMEQVLILSEMKTDDRVRILEKMDPKKAAEASIYLKDAIPAKDKQIAALQERLKLAEAASTNAAAKLTKNELSQTIANMTPKSAATMLIEMEKATPAKVTEILNGMDVQARSKVMSSISDTSKEAAASIIARLAP